MRGPRITSMTDGRQGRGRRRLRIAQVSPLYESVPPKLYGGTERVVSNLTEELVRQGHDVTLFASGDSTTAATLVPCCPRSLRLDPECVDSLAHHMVMLERVFSRANEFDIIHFHVDYLHFPVSRRARLPQVTTLHGRLDLPDLVPIYRTFDDMPLISISDAQRRPLAFANWQRTVLHGLPREQLSFHPGPGSYLAFLGRISPEKRVDRAIEIAKRIGMPLKIAAKVDKADKEYFDQKISPLLNDAGVEFVGEINEQQKDAFLGEAAALLFPIDWPEPFGLVMIEAMACGTPVVAFRHGSVPEVIEPGVSGFIVEDVDAAVKATEAALSLSRRGCRDDFEARFTAERMAHDYVAAYEALIRPAAAEISSLVSVLTERKSVGVS
jgi:glycosyltransferase involved in cell wall biosynthesis